MKSNRNRERKKSAKIEYSNAIHHTFSPRAIFISRFMRLASPLVTLALLSFAYYLYTRFFSFAHFSSYRCCYLYVVRFLPTSKQKRTMIRLSVNSILFYSIRFNSIELKIEFKAMQIIVFFFLFNFRLFHFFFHLLLSELSIRSL